MKKKILSFWSGHDASFCVLEDGIPTLHTEAERHTRIKEGAYDSIKLFNEHDGMLNVHDSNTKDVIALATCYSENGIKNHSESWDGIKDLAPLHIVGHHQAHAAHAFYSSNFDKAVVITIDGGGIENSDGYCVGASIWVGTDTKLELKRYIPLEQMNIGGVWARVTRHVFKYESGAPFGNQAGTVMALAAFAKNSERFIDRFRDMFSVHLSEATMRAPGHVNGMSAKDPRNPIHPYLNDLAELAAQDEQTKYDIAGALQIVTEEKIIFLIRKALEGTYCGNVCFSGGVALNSVAMGKMINIFPMERFYIPPVPYDAGLTIGAAQFVWHNEFGNPRIKWGENASPYLGHKYNLDMYDMLRSSEVFDVKRTNDDEVVDLLISGKIVSVFNGSAESGRRALGNRSILADPRSTEMKDKVNEKVKHRQSFRPFAPSVLLEHVSEWFENNQESPFMGFVLKFKPEKGKLVPAVMHNDGTARLQTVTEKSNPWYYGLIKKFYDKTGVPMLLNTSFNDMEPIVENQTHAINCFAKTEIDYLYFVEPNCLVSKKSTK